MPTPTPALLTVMSTGSIPHEGHYFIFSLIIFFISTSQYLPEEERSNGQKEKRQPVEGSGSGQRF
jgi:hypothetical protein